MAQRERFRPPFLRLLFLPPLLPPFLRGTFAPFFRASERPIAIACLRLFTFPPFPPRPLLSVPFFFRRIALATRLPADFPYFRPPLFFLPPFFAAILGLHCCGRPGSTIHRHARPTNQPGPLQEAFQQRLTSKEKRPLPPAFRPRGAAGHSVSRKAGRPRARPCRMLPTPTRPLLRQARPTDSGHRGTVGSSRSPRS